MTAAKHKVTIKGVRDGLVFVLDDKCDFTEVMAELEQKLQKTHKKFFVGPAVQVIVKTGERLLSEEQQAQVKEVISRKDNLLLRDIQSDLAAPVPAPPGITVMQGIVRSGQTVRHEGNLMYLGDVNPGGSLLCTGDIYIMGSLRGMAHAGIDGDEKSIIAASHLKPTQLRIAAVISRPPEEWGIEETYMEFAYIRDGVMEIDKIANLQRIRA